MKINVFHSKYLMILILLTKLLFIWSNSIQKIKSENNSILSVVSQDVNLRSLHLHKDGRLIARCPDNTVMVKIAFEKNKYNSNKERLDVGFNCRTEKNILSSEREEKIVISSDFENITPPNIQCGKDSVLMGIEMIKIKEKVQFIWYCGRVYLKDECKSTDSFFEKKTFDKKKFTEFLSNSKIGVDIDSDDGIRSIEFGRDQNNYLFFKVRRCPISNTPTNNGKSKPIKPNHRKKY